jgi:hypothetical protein
MRQEERRRENGSMINTLILGMKMTALTSDMLALIRNLTLPQEGALIDKNDKVGDLCIKQAKRKILG